MSTNTPATRRGRPKTERMLQIARQILAILTQDHPQSVRHVFYRLLDPTLPLPLPKTEAGYKCVQRALVDLRRAGQVPYSWISDATRWGYYVSAYQHAADALQAAAYAYRVDLWSQADTYVEVWTESRSMVGVIRDVIEELAVPLYAAGGFSSLTLANNAAEHIGRLANGRPVRILYIGDWDPAGVLIDEKVLDELRGHLPHLDIAEHRLAITAEQAAELPSKPRKRGEKRRPDILRTVEAEAMPADALRALLRRTAEEYLPPRALEITRTVEAQEQQSILAMAAAVRRLGVQGAVEALAG